MQIIDSHQIEHGLLQTSGASVEKIKFRRLGKHGRFNALRPQIDALQFLTHNRVDCGQQFAAGDRPLAAGLQHGRGLIDDSQIRSQAER